VRLFSNFHLSFRALSLLSLRAPICRGAAISLPPAEIASALSCLAVTGGVRASQRQGGGLLATTEEVSLPQRKPNGKIQITIEIQMPRLPSPGLLALKLQRRQAGRLNAKTTPFCHWDFELYLAFELCHLILFRTPPTEIASPR